MFTHACRETGKVSVFQELTTQTCHTSIHFDTLQVPDFRAGPDAPSERKLLPIPTNAACHAAAQGDASALMHMELEVLRLPVMSSMILSHLSHSAGGWAFFKRRAAMSLQLKVNTWLEYVRLRHTHMWHVTLRNGKVISLFDWQFESSIHGWGGPAGLRWVWQHPVPRWRVCLLSFESSSSQLPNPFNPCYPCFFFPLKQTKIDLGGGIWKRPCSGSATVCWRWCKCQRLQNPWPFRSHKHAARSISFLRVKLIWRIPAFEKAKCKTQRLRTFSLIGRGTRSTRCGSDYCLSPFLCSYFWNGVCPCLYQLYTSDVLAACSSPCLALSAGFGGNSALARACRRGHESVLEMLLLGLGLTDPS